MNRSGSTSTDSNSTSSSNLNRQDGAYRQGSVSSGTTSATPNLNKPAETGTGEAVSGAANAPITNPSARTRSTTLADFVASQPDYSTFQNALQSVDLVNTLKEGQAYTLFAPSNAAFKKLPAVTQNVLLEGQNKESLKKLLTYHVIQGTMDAKELAKRINAGNGTAQLKTLSGGLLTAKLGSNNRVIITDEQGNSAYVDTSDQIQTNGVIHGIDNVLMPKANSIIFK